MKKKRMVEVIDIWCDQCGGRLKPYAFNYSGYGKDFCSNGCVYQYEREHPEERAELDRLLELASGELDRIMREEAENGNSN